MNRLKAASKFLPKNILYTIVPVIALITVFSLQYYCSWSGSKDADFPGKPGIQQNTEHLRASGIKLPTKEIKPGAKPDVRPEKYQGLNIPGRTVQSAVFSPGKPGSLSIDGARLTIPVDAIKGIKSLSVTGLISEDLPPVPAEIINVTKSFPGYRFLPHGEHFKTPAYVTLAYDKTLIPEGFTPDDIYTFYFDERDSRWKALDRDSIDLLASLVVSNTLHFTDMINGIIMVPGLPQTNGYVPTTIKEMKAADPAAEISMVAPPSANNEGTANISYPIKLPSGRAGMQPVLALQYNSNGGSGWTGYGWSLDFPGISVDVTWGVPRYDTLMESETYLLAGSQLTPVAHRGEYVERTAEKQFYPRIESDFDKIVRHGNRPNNYWWEVTSKEGTKKYYGGLPETGIIENAVNKDTRGSIGYWALTQSRDMYGNTVNYTYEKPAGAGEQIYISEITYTGHNEEAGPYKVSFLRNDDEGSFTRKDGRINARMGFIQRDLELLQRIEILYRNEPIRSYTLQFREGAFSKTMLESITELDASGKEFYTYHFSYYDDVQYKNGYVPYSERKIKRLPDDNLKDPHVNLASIFFDHVSALGGSGSTGGSGGSAVTVGAYDGMLHLKSSTAGGNASYQGSTSEGFLTLVDINGDGLPDKVYKKGDKIYYRPNILKSGGDELFGSERLVQGISKISISKSSGFGTGAEAHPPFSFVGYNYSNSKTKTSVYFSDFNADGLIDLACDGKVYFNHLDANLDPVFSTSSALTPNPLYASSDIDTSILPRPADEQAELEKQFPLHDAVRLWQAPYNGQVRIDAPVQLLEDISSKARSYKYKDGVRVSVQLNKDTLWSAEIDSGDFAIKPCLLDSVSINKGNRLFFRIQSRKNGLYDEVHWDPLIIYDSISGPDTLVKYEDVNRKKIARYKASEDFVLSGRQSVSIPKNGTIRIRSSFSKQFTTDSLKLQIVLSDTSGHHQYLYDLDFGFSPSVYNIDSQHEVDSGYFLEFRAITNTTIDWPGIKWNNLVEYIGFRNDTITPVFDKNEKPLLSFKTVPEYAIMYNYPVRHELAAIVDTAILISAGLDSIDNLPHIIKITPRLAFSDSYADSTNIILSVKTKDELLGKTNYLFKSDKIVNRDTVFAEVKMGDTVFFDYHFHDFMLAENNTLANVVIGADSLHPLKASIFSVINPKDEIFGHLYRGWGQFDYKGNDQRIKEPINTALLKIPNEPNKNIKNINDSASLMGAYNPMNDTFIIMVPYADKGFYMGVDTLVYVATETMSASRLGEKNVIVEPLILTGSGLSAITKVSRDESHSLAAGVGVGPASASYSHSWASNNIIVDMMDMNGDRFPDLLSTNKIQYTGVSGAIKGSAIDHDLGDHYSKSDANGFTLGGTFVVAKSSNSLSPLPSKGVKVIIGDNFKTNKNSKSAEETSKSTIGISGNMSFCSDHAEQTWLDVNGDGLPDKIYNDSKVQLNLGYTFAPKEDWNFDAIRSGPSKDYGGGIGVNISNGSIIGGVSISKTENEADNALMDVNGDGLPDMVKGNRVRFNTGSGFAPEVDWDGLGAIDKGSSIGYSTNFGFTVGITFVIIPIKICVNPSGSVSQGVSMTITQLADIDGDGMPDVLYSDREDSIKVRTSAINRTNLLERVQNPLGSHFDIDYKLTEPSYELPGATMVMASVKTFDGLAGDGADTSFTTFDYENGMYDRHERQFYGFGSVKTHFHNTANGNKKYRTLAQRYGNENYYLKGILLSDTLIDGEGMYQTGSGHTYNLYDIHTGALLPKAFYDNDNAPAYLTLDSTKNYFYQNSTVPLITTKVTYSADLMGNVIGYTDYSSGNSKDKITVNITYHVNDSSYIYSIPSGQEIITSQRQMRKRETSVNKYGSITQIRQYISDSQTAQYDMEYDEFGNIVKITRPANYKGERMWYAYQYDSTVHTYITRITDAYGYASSSVYDYKWGLPVEKDDINNQKILYTYDDCGRLQTITGPYEISAGKPYAASFDYHPDAQVPYARTLHYDSVYNNIEIYSFTDGIGRPVQVKKSASCFVNADSEDTPGYLVSGKVLYDPFGRISETYQPLIETTNSPATYNPQQDLIAPIIARYDVRDRVIKIILPDETESSQKYSIGYFQGGMAHIDTLTDALGRQKLTYTNPRGHKIAEILKTSSGDIITGYEFNPLGELVSATDPKGNITLLGYDKLGRRNSIKQPDLGWTELIYDDAGNITKKITSNLRSQITEGGAITYHYDRERLVEIVYPRNVQNRVNYSYGSYGDAFNRAGRIVLVQDASGGQEFFYGPLGEITKTIRTIQIGDADMRTWIWSAGYDTWNRIQNMTYPDGETVTYTYNRAGNLSGMHGEKLGRSYTYISRIGYDKFERQAYLLYGNGAVTTYQYEPERQRLSAFEVKSNGNTLLNNSFTYDALDNILGIANNAQAIGETGGTFTHSYSYDELNRLIQASGSFSGNTDNSDYTLSMLYDAMGNILHKEQSHNLNGEILAATTYDLNYTYNGIKPNAADIIGSRKFAYDENGNQVSWEDTVTSDFRQIWWDEENRLALISDNGYLNRYVYDASGERVIKSHGGSQGVYINGAPAGIINHSDNNYTIYVNPFFTLQNDKFTKHYYAGSSRILSKTGNGQFENQYRPGAFEITAGNVNYINRQQQLRNGVEEYIETLSIPPGPPTMKGIYADPSYTQQAYPDAGTPDTITPRGWPRQPVFAPAGGSPGAPIQWGDEINNDNILPGFGYVGTGNIEEKLPYYYHPDHLGSTNYITNAQGNVTQFVAYLPYGEIFAEQHTDWDSPYKFNAKEIDAETGLYYYGARYYDPKTSTWVSADPLANIEKAWSPYRYAFDNPLKFTDPDGRHEGWADIKGDGHWKWYRAGENFTRDKKTRLAKPGHTYHSRFGNITLEDKGKWAIGGRTVHRYKPGSDSKVAIIGRKMAGHVEEAAENLARENKRVEIFSESHQKDNKFVIDGRIKTWKGISLDFKNMWGQYAKDEKGWIIDVTNTQMYKANQIWAEKLRSQGYTIFDIGVPKGPALPKSDFYEMEKQTIFR